MVELHPPGVDAVAATVADAVEAGMTRLVVAGGDGLLHQALPAVAGTGVPVGIVPVGTGNDFARALGLPTKVRPAVEAALAGMAAPVAVDLVRIDAASASDPGSDGPGADGSAEPPEHEVSSGPDGSAEPLQRQRQPVGWAASVVTGGFSGQVSLRALGLRFPPGQQRYTVATLLELPRLETVDLRLDIDGTVHEQQSSLFAIANTRYFGGGMMICPDAVADDGMLDVTVVGPTTKWELARMLPTVFSGKHVEHPACTTYRGRSVEVTVDADLWADGERITGSRFTAAPGALLVAGARAHSIR